MERFHHAALDVLEKVGLSEASDSMVRRLERAGGRVSEDGRLAEAGSPDIRDAARIRVREILENHFPAHIPPDIEQTIRRNHAIHLPPRCHGKTVGTRNEQHHG